MGAADKPDGIKPQGAGDHAEPIHGQDIHEESSPGSIADVITLVARSRKRDNEAYALLVQNYQRMIHSLTYRMTGSLADADDLAQETFIRAFRRLGTYDKAYKLSTWLYRIAVNACLDFRAREARRQRTHAGWSDAAGVAGPRETAAAADDELGDPVQAALLRLPEKQRSAIVLTILNGLSHAEAAEASGCSEATLSWRVFAARRKLKRWLDRRKGNP
jgi:RNA polymerase sigma-70 factor, ECF subfamily